MLPEGVVLDLMPALWVFGSAILKKHLRSFLETVTMSREGD